MKTETKNILKAASVYIGVILGAGFASGQELIQFFARFGMIGIVGIVATAFVLSIVGWAVMDICVRLSLKDYNSFITVILGKKFGTVMDYAINAFICVMFCAMLAGTGAMGVQAFDLPFSVGVIAISLLCFVVLLFDLDGVVKINFVLVPILIVGGIFFGVYTIVTDYAPAFMESGNPFNQLTNNFLWSAIIYASYNLITAVSVLSNMNNIVTSRKIAKRAGLLGGICIGCLGLFFTLPLIVHKDILAGLEIPMLGLSQKFGKPIEIIYIIFLIAAIFTTAVSNALAAVEWLYRKTGIKKIYVKMFVCLAGIIGANIGFSTFVGKAYPVFGYIGIFEIVVIIIFFLFGKKEVEK